MVRSSGLHYHVLSTQALKELWHYVQENLGVTPRSLRDKFGVPKNFAEAYLREALVSQTAEAFHRRHNRGRRWQRSLGREQKLRGVLSRDCTLTLRGMRRGLRRQFCVHVSIRTIGTDLKRMGWTRKRLGLVPVSRNSSRVKNLRVAYGEWLQTPLDQSLVFADEFGVNLHSTPHYGWAPSGETPRQVVPDQRGSNISVALALTADGTLVHQIQTRPFNASSFTEFLADRLFPALGDTSRWVVNDNARFHHSQIVADAFAESSHDLKFLPP